MAKHDEEKGLSNEGFWSMDRIILAVVFILGILLGGYLTHNFITPALGGSFSVAQDANNSQLNERFDARADELYNCLLANEIDPQTCSAS